MGRRSPATAWPNLWWDSVEALQAAFAIQEGRAAGAKLLEDERGFIDLERSPLLIGEEVILVGE